MRSLAIMQPYFFPYLGYYSLIFNSEQFVLFDTVQFIRHGWIERNRILKPQEGWQYVSVPLEKHKLGTKIQNVRIRLGEDWRDKILRQLVHYKRRSPYYAQAMEVIEESIKIDTSSIVDLNKNILEKTCEYIGFNPKINVFSDMPIEVEDAAHPGEWALNISRALGANEYINPTGGVEIFDKNLFEINNIKLSFMGNRLSKYPQRRAEFESGLSIIDVMMFNTPSRILELLQETYYLD